MAQGVKSRIRGRPPFPIGASWDGEGVNFALFSANATKVEVCLFDQNGETGLERIAPPEHTDQIYHGYIPDVGPGLIYGYRAHGPYEPDAGRRFNPTKLLLDPYARPRRRAQVEPGALFGYTPRRQASAMRWTLSPAVVTATRRPSRSRRARPNSSSSRCAALRAVGWR